MTPADLAPKHARLAEIDRELTRLQAQHDLAMTAFKFDEANTLQSQVASLEDMRRAIAAALPPEPAAAVSLGVVPVFARPRRAWRRR